MIAPTKTRRFAVLTITLFILAACTTTQTPTPSALTQSEHSTLVEYALTLINQARTDADLNAVTLDTNPAAQSHAEQSMANCTRGHWGPDGTKPYMRYTLAGGEQYSAENVFAIDFCPEDPERYTSDTPMEQINYAMDLFMNSPGHRANILNPHHRKVGIGLTYRDPTIWLVQLFVGDFIQYDTKPTIESGTLTLSGYTKNGAHITADTSTLTIYYDPPPRPLTQGQLSRTYCYSNGQPIVSIRPPPEPGSSYTSDETTIETTFKPCPDPYELDPNVLPPTSPEEARSNWQNARDSSRSENTRLLTFPSITATEWKTHNDTFAITADISDLLNQHGNGVYTIVLWGGINGDRTPISEYSIFVPPTP